MPIIKSAKKQMRQSLKHQKNNYPVRSLMKTVIKKELLLIKEGKTEEAKKYLSEAYKVIDTACKKNIVHPKNAARKKSLLARGLSGMGKVSEKVK